MRIAFLNHFQPLAQDLVVAGENRDDIGALVFPNFAALAAIAPGLSPDEMVRDPRVKAAFAGRLKSLGAAATGSSTRIVRLALLSAPPSIDLGEATDKGSLNQRLLLANRAETVEALYGPAIADNEVRLS